MGRRVDSIPADEPVADLDQVDPVPFDRFARVRVRRLRRPLGNDVILAGHHPFIAFDEPHVRPACVDRREVAPDRVDPLDTLATGHVLEDEVGGDERDDRIYVAGEERVPVTSCELERGRERRRAAALSATPDDLDPVAVGIAHEAEPRSALADL